jgi:D-proline reductase (dithiol) PrdB
MSDKVVRKMLSRLEGYSFDEVPWVNPKPLSECRVAVVTTAGLNQEGNADWNPGDQGFTVLSGKKDDFTLGHYSPNFDRTGWVVDSNVVIPLDRLNEMAAEGKIGSVSDTHISFMGAQPDHTLETIRLDTGPAAANILLEEEVDVVLLTPV